jgi:hypothetical protein
MINGIIGLANQRDRVACQKLDKSVHNEDAVPVKLNDTSISFAITLMARELAFKADGSSAADTRRTALSDKQNHELEA